MICELLHSLQIYLDLKEHGEVLTLIDRVEAAISISFVDSNTKSKLAYAACHALVVCRERGVLQDNAATEERIRALLDKCGEEHA